MYLEHEFPRAPRSQAPERPSEGRADHLGRLLSRLDAASTVVLTTHINADGDGAGCEAALASWLTARGSRVSIVNPSPFPDGYRFLLEDESWVVEARDPRAEAVCRDADLALVVDTSEVGRLGRVKPMLDPIPRLVIDHHQVSGQPIEGDVLRDPSACAAGELVYELIHQAGGPWTQAVIEGLYVALLTDTGGFRFSNTSAACHRIVADLVARGVEPESIHSRVYGAFPLRRFRLLQEALPTLEYDHACGVAWMTVPDEAFVRLGATPEDLEGFVDYPRSIEGVEVALLFREIRPGETKVSFRANGTVDVNALARHFGGGGHTKAAGALVRAALEETRALVVDSTRSAVRETLGPPSGETPDALAR